MLRVQDIPIFLAAGAELGSTLGVTLGLRLVTTFTGVASHWYAAPNRLQGFTTSPAICLLVAKFELVLGCATPDSTTGALMLSFHRQRHIHPTSNEPVSIFTPLTLVGDLRANARDNVAKLRFDTIYNGVYNTEDLNIAWLSVLGSLAGISIWERRNEGYFAFS